MPGADAIVFVVDDDVSVREALESLIRSAGLRVESFASAEEFLARRHGDDSGCLVLDVSLPDLSGIELQARMASLDLDLPIIFITAHGDARVRIQAMREGAAEFLMKPFDDRVLLKRVRAAFDR